MGVYVISKIWVVRIVQLEIEKILYQQNYYSNDNCNNDYGRHVFHKIIIKTLAWFFMKTTSSSKIFSIIFCFICILLKFKNKQWQLNHFLDPLLSKSQSIKRRLTLLLRFLSLEDFIDTILLKINYQRRLFLKKSMQHIREANTV